MSLKIFTEKQDHKIPIHFVQEDEQSMQWTICNFQTKMKGKRDEEWMKSVERKHLKCLHCNVLDTINCCFYIVS